MMLNLLECTPIAQYAIGIDHKITFWNKACELLTGFSAKEMVNTANQWQAFYPYKRPVLADLILQQDFDRFLDIYQGKSPAVSEIVPYAWEATDFFPKMNNKSRYIYFLAAPVFDNNGMMTGAVTTLQDVTQQKQLEIDMKIESEQLHRQNIELMSSLKERYKFCNIVGKSPKMQAVYDLIMNAAASMDTVIIYGESGSGKELVAQAIHKMSNRHNNVFVPVNCGAIPENLLETEFFGHVKGAFSGAHTDRKGFLDHADGGTLFLDEIGEISQSLQVKLLRAIEGGGYQPVGSNAVKYSDFRIVAATNRNLRDAVDAGKIRHDFFYRIHVIPVNIPPLRERKEDLALLIDYFLSTLETTTTINEIPGKLMEKIYSYHWPGNVRELQNVLKRYLSLGELEFLSSTAVTPPPETDLTDIRPPIPAPHGQSLHTAMETYEQQLLLDALKRTHGHKAKAARLLGVSRRTFFRKLEKYET